MFNQFGIRKFNEIFPENTYFGELDSIKSEILKLQNFNFNE